MGILGFILWGVIVSVLLSVFNLVFLAGFQGLPSSGMSNREYFLTTKKIVAFFSSVSVSAIGAVLGFIFELNFESVLARIIVMNILCFLAWIDSKEQIVPNAYLIRLLVVAAIWLIIRIILAGISGETFANIVFAAVFGAAVMFIPMFLGYVISRGGVGAGDVKLLSIIGVFLGFRGSYILLLLAFLISTVYCVVQIIRKKINLKSHLPFVPFLATASVMMVIIGI